MMRTPARRAARFVLPVVLVLLWAIIPTNGQSQSYGTPNGEWQTHGGDLVSIGGPGHPAELVVYRLGS